VLNIATPEAFNATVPNDVTPSKNSAFPAGVPVPGATTATVAVNVTDCPNFEGFTLDATVVVVEIALTVSANGVGSELPACAPFAA
jgi:hypothetical protein